MDLSVEISTYNRKDVLRVVLEKLTRQSLPASQFEVVISDDGSSDGLVDMVQSMVSDLPYHVTILRNPRQGVGKTHNAGIRACRADVVLMLAADIYAVPQLLEEHLRSHQKHSEPTTVVAGHLRQSPDLPNRACQRAFDKVVAQIFDHQTSGHHVANFLVSNLSFKKQFVMDHGMFREWPYAAGEDIELGFRLKSHGMQIIDNPQALGYHFHEIALDGLALRSYSSGYHAFLLAEHVEDADFRSCFPLLAGQPGGPSLMRSRLKHAARTLLANRVTMPTIVLPLIHLAERFRPLEPILPALLRRVLANCYFQGVRDYRRGIPFDPIHGRIYPTD